MHTGDSGFLFWIQNALVVDPLLQILLRLFAQLEVFDRNLSDEFEVFLELLTGLQVIVVELHPGDTGVFCWTDSERRHSSSVNVQCAVGKEVKEQSVVRLLRICHVLREVLMIVDSVERRRIVYGEGRMRILAVQAFLVSINPLLCC